MKKMKKSRSIKLSDLEALQSPPPRRSLSQPRKPTLLHVPSTTESPQKQKQKPLVRRSPNYMKPTTSSDAKKEFLLASLRNTQSSLDGKNLLQTSSSNSKATSVSSKNPAKSLPRSSSMSLVRTLTKIPSFKPCRACPRKSTTAVLCAEISAPDRATCSSTLKHCKFPVYLKLNPGSTESEGASIMKVCPYTYCSLNGHRHDALPQLKSFMSASRRLLKTQKNIKLEGLSPPRLQVPCETKDSDNEQIIFDGKPACDEADMGNPIITPLAQEIGMDLFIEIYAKEKEGADKMGRFNSVKHLEDQKGTEFAIEENGNAAEENGVKQVNPPGMPHDLPKSEIALEEDFKNNFNAAAIEADTEGSFHQELSAGDADENHPPSWFDEEICTGSYCSEVHYDGEHVENIELDDFDSQDTDMEWEEEQLCAVNHEDNINSSDMEEETDSKFESLSESSYGISEIWLNDILSNHYADILLEEALQATKEEKSTCFEAQPHTDSVLEGTNDSIKFKIQETDYPSNCTSYEYDQSSLTEEVLHHLTNSEDDNRESEKHVDDGTNCASVVLDEDTTENSKGYNITEACKIDESSEDSITSLKINDKGINQKNQIHSPDEPEESTIIVQDQKLLEEDQVRASKFHTACCIGGEEQSTGKNCQWAARHKRPVQDFEEMRKINPRKPNFLPLLPDPEPEKVDLKHQMMDERKNAEEWMLDFALRQAVTKLAPAGKRRVALLVEAFETVMSIPKCETHMKNDSPFAHARPIQACS
ncbi:Calmodulin-binding domain, plant [Sesbania bispinosa]|nr:Calmodulin-binding domain, plant [Sesbania bispinosa]